MKIITNDDLITKYLSKDEITEINKEADKIRKKLHGGKRENSGRKQIIKGKVLKFTKRLTEEEVNFINYARIHKINYEQLMQG